MKLDWQHQLPLLRCVGTLLDAVVGWGRHGGCSKVFSSYFVAAMGAKAPAGDRR